MTALPSAAVADLLGQPTDEARRRHLIAEGLADLEGLSWILDRSQELVHDDPEAATQLADLADGVADDLGLPVVSARARYLVARVHAERGEPDRALTLIDQARDLWRGAGQPLQALRTDLGRMQILDDLGRHRDAAATGTGLIAALEELEPGDEDDRELQVWMRAAALENTGVAYGFVGEHERALEAYAQAETSFLELGLVEETARPQANRGVELLELGRGREARAVLQSAAEVFAASGDRLWAAKCRGYLAQALEQLGELRAALEVLEPARVTLDELGAEAEAARIRLAIAGVYLAVGLAEEARAEADAALQATLASGLAHDAATARYTLAQALMASGDLDDAGLQIRAAVAMFADVGDARGQARATLAEAEIAGARGRRGEASERAAAAAEALEAGGWLVPLAWAELRLFDNAEAGDASAVNHLDRATALAAQLGLPPLRYACEIRTAQIRRREGRITQAESLLRTALDDVELLGASLPDHEMRRAFRADRLAAYDSLIELLLDRSAGADVAEALDISDRAKSRTLEDLRAGTIGLQSNAERELGQLRSDLNSVYSALTSGDPVQAPTLRQRAAELEGQVKLLRARSAAGAGSASTDQPFRRETPSVRRPGSVALEYHVTGDDVIAFVSRDGDVEARRLSGVLPEVHDNLDRLAAQWTRFRMGSAFAGRHTATLVATSRQILGSLYRLLIAPVADRLEHAGDLVVVPHRRLHQVPFHALHDGKSHLLEQTAVTVSPSLGERGQSAASLDRGALVLALPDAHAQSVGREASALAGLLPDVRVLLGPAATTEALVQAVPGPGVVHVACHGLYRAANPLFSSLRLADRWMAAAEMLDLDLDGALVTLSACESGRHGSATVEPVGLGWSFLAAGASGVVVSQWVVDDAVTASLMSEFYRELVAGRAPPEALRRAQLAIADHHPHPFFWAPFVYVAQPP